MVNITKEDIFIFGAHDENGQRTFKYQFKIVDFEKNKIFPHTFLEPLGNLFIWEGSHLE